MARAIWKGVIRFGSTRVPVKLYSATRDHRVHFRLLHGKDHVPVEQHMVHPETNTPLEHSEIVRGFPLASGAYVILTDEDLAQLEPEPSRDIEITRFVDPKNIHHQWYERPYFLGPDGQVELYFALVQALSETRKEGVARWVMRKRDYVGSLRVRDGYLMLVTLRHAEEVVTASELPRPRGREIRANERQMAEQLVRMYEGEFNPSDYKNEYQERVLELVRTKAKGGKVHLEKAVRRAPERSLSDALKASIAKAARRQKVA